MLETLVAIALCCLIVERSTELLHASKIFLPLRNWVALRAYPPGAPPPLSWRLEPGRGAALFVHELLSCGYCSSVWVAMIVAIWCPLLPILPSRLGLINWLGKVLVIHGGANAYHVIYERARQGRVRTYDIKAELICDVRSIGEMAGETGDSLAARTDSGDTDLE